MEVEQYQKKKKMDMQKKKKKKHKHKWGNKQEFTPRSCTKTSLRSSEDLCNWNLKKLDGIVKLKSLNLLKPNLWN